MNCNISDDQKYEVKVMNKNVKHFLSKKVFFVLTVMIIFSIFVTPISAVNGILTFVHGVNNTDKSTFGKTISTDLEYSMSINGHIYFASGPNIGSYAFYQWAPVSNTKSITKIIYPGSVKGSSYFQYYVDYSLQHSSTAWWSFDFR